jgi:two-component system chemotaxis response regulator CheY
MCETIVHLPRARTRRGRRHRTATKQPSPPATIRLGDHVCVHRLGRLPRGVSARLTTAESRQWFATAAHQTMNTASVNGISSAGVILVVEDDLRVLRLIARVLRFGGFIAIEAPTTETARSLLDEGLIPDAVLLDLRMPGVGGLGFLLRLRSSPAYASVPVTILTGDVFIDSTTEAAALAMGATLTFKPLETQDILSLVRGMMQPSATCSVARST